MWFGPSTARTRYYFPSTVLIKTSPPLAWQFISCRLWQPGVQSEETICFSADLPVVGFCSGWSGLSLLVFSVTVIAGGAREGSALLMRLSLIKHQQVSYAKHQHKSILRQFASSCFCLWGFLLLCMGQFARDTSPPAGYYPRQRYVRGSSPLPRRACVCGTCGWARRGCTPRPPGFLLTLPCWTAMRRGPPTPLRVSVLPTRAEMSSPIKVEPEEAGLRRGG